MSTRCTTSSHQRTILIDQDGVLADYNGHAIAIMTTRHPDLVPLFPKEEIRRDVDENFDPQFREEFMELVRSPGFIRSLPPIPGAVDAMRDLLDRGFDVRICTAPHMGYPHNLSEKVEWVHAHLGAAFAERMILTRDKTLVRGEILIDDKPVITGVTTPTWEHVLFDHPYNRHIAGRRLTWANYHKVLGL